MGQIVFSQNPSLKQANRLFAEKAYYDAIEAYELQPEQTQKSLQNIADSYYYVGNAKKAAETYAKVFNLFENIDDSYTLRYADAAKASGDYDKANELLSEYSGNDIHILEAIEASDKTVPYTYSPELIDGLSESSDFGAAYYDRQIVFSSNRNLARPVYARTNEPFLDLYYAKVSGTTITDEGLFPGEINTDMHESNAAFSADGQTMYFTRNNDKYKRVGLERVAVLQIYKADLIGGKWLNIEPVSFSSDSYSVAHPSLSSDGTKLYFSSDMPGGFGSYDIYVVDVLNDGSFGEPKNLGAAINTDQREQFPFISDAGNLYFASNRYTGLGGLDLYGSTYENGSFNQAYNLGSTINSSRDDFSLIVKERHRNGYFSSNRTGKDKIYRFDVFSNKDHIVLGTVKDVNSGEALPGAQVRITDSDGKVMQDTIVGQDGVYKFKVKPNSNYVVRGSRELYISTEKELQIKDAAVTQSNIDLLLLSYADAEEKVTKNERNDLTQIKLDKIYFDFDKSSIRSDAAIILDELVGFMTKYPDMHVEVSAHTDYRGSDKYNQILSQQRAASTLEYLVSKGIDRDRLQSQGYGESQPINDCENQDCTDDEIDENRRCEFTILK